MITVHLAFLLCNKARLTEPNGFLPQGSAKAPSHTYERGDLIETLATYVARSVIPQSMGRKT